LRWTRASSACGFIFDPLEKRQTRIRGEVTLVGAAEVEALEYRFE
jgi:hypothetical protein